jgi:predicted amidohydrolase
MTPFTIAGVQMHLGNYSNVDAMRRRLDVLMHLHPAVQMVLFSELAPYGPMLEHAQRLPGPAEAPFQEMARRHGLWLLTGSMFEKCDDGIFNTTSVIDPAGTVIGRYRKMFPFLPFEAGVGAGTTFLAFDVPEVGRFGVSNCYDLWFPETTRTLSAMGVEVLLHPVLTHTIDRDVDLAVAQASAAIFQCYVFDINGLGACGNGRSAVFDPSGRVLYRADTTDQLIPVEVDLDQVRRQRERGLRGLGQPLKSFRDRAVEFSVYDRAAWDASYLASLGPLRKAERPQPPPAAGAAPAEPPRANPDLLR